MTDPNLPVRSFCSVPFRSILLRSVLVRLRAVVLDYVRLCSVPFRAVLLSITFGYVRSSWVPFGPVRFFLFG